MKLRYINAIIVLALTILLSSCPTPLTRTVMDNANDLIAPEITISSPAEYSSYGRTIQITGSVSDLADSSGVAGDVDTLTWEILTQTLPQEVTISADGSFLIESDITLTENIVISLNAVDWNGNSTEIRLPLVYEGNDIPSFEADPKSRQVVLTWDVVPGVETYTVYIEASALAPTVNSVNKISGITSPYTIDNLKNGTVYSFLLEGSSAAGPDNYSTVVRGIPLSTYDLFPRVQTGFNHLEVEWTALDGINSYEVMRSSSPNGPFSSVSGPITAVTYNDWNVRQGEVYYYGIKPAEYCDIVSETAEGRLYPFPPYKDAEVAHYMTPASPRNSAVKDNYLFIADYSSGLHVADITVPSVPLPVTTLSISSAKDVVISGNTAYVTGGQSLYVVDITDPSNPGITGSVQVTNSQAEGLDVQGNLVAVACFNDGFSLVDVSDPANPVVSHHEEKTGGTYTLGQAYDAELRVIGSLMYLFLSNNLTTAIYRIAGTPGSPILYARSNTLPGSDEVAVSENGSYLYLAGSWYIRSYSIVSLFSPTSLDLLDPSPDEPVEGIAVSGDRAYITMRDVGFATIDISDPNNMSELVVFNTPGEAQGITVDSGYAFVSDGSGYGLHIYGIAEPESPMLLDTYTGLVGPTDLTLQGDYLFVTETANDWQMTVLDISNPLSVAYAGGTTSYTPVGMKVVGDRIFFAAERSGTMMYDISDPASPDVLPPWYVSVQGGYANAIDVLGRYSAVVTSGSMINIFDLSWENNISAVGAVTVGTGTESAEDVVYRGDYAYIADSADGMRIADLTDPRWPEMASGSGWTTGDVVALDVVDDLVYVADTINGLYVFDVTNPNSVSTVYGLGAGPGATDIEVRGDFAILACGASGVRIYNVADPTSPVLIQNYPGITADKILVIDDILYALDNAGGELNVLDLMP